MVIPDPKSGRFDAAARWLGVAAVTAATLAAATLVASALAVPEPVGQVLGTLAIVLVVAVPIVRLAWLGARWWRRGDRRFAWLPPAIIAVIVVGLVVGLA